MKKVLLFFVFALIGHFALIAQDGQSLLKEASKKLSDYTASPFTNANALTEARDFVEQAFQDESLLSNPGAWLSRGEIYFSMGESQLNNVLLNPEAAISEMTAPALAIEAYIKASELSDKKKDIKAALKGLREAQELSNNMGVQLYQTQDYEASFANFEAELKAHDALKAAGEESRLDQEGFHSEKLYFAGITSYFSSMPEKTIKYMEAAHSAGTEESSLYQLVSEAYASLGNDDKAKEWLESGRKRFPDDSGLLFAEINYYLAKGEMSAMIDKLKEALVIEPDNISVIVTLGQVYDQLQVKAFQEGNAEEAERDFQEAFNYYSRALEIDPDNFDLNYSIGALYYNKAANMTQQLNEYAEDFSAEGTKKYDAVKNEMAGYFDQALPYFQKADSIDDADRNTIIALKEIYARKDMFEKSNEYKEKLETLPE